MTPATYGCGGAQPTLVTSRFNTHTFWREAMKALMMGLAIGVLAMTQAVQSIEAPKSAPQAAAAEVPAVPVTPAQASFDRLKTLFGRWEAPLGNGKTIVDTFQP